MSYQKITSGIHAVLHRPLLVLFICLGFMAASLVLRGNLWRLWGLYRDQQQLSQDLNSAQKQIEKIEVKLNNVKDPAYMERMAHDKLDLADEEDLIFVFSDAN